MILRLATVKALELHSGSGLSVRDSQIAPIDKAIRDASAPFLSVFIDQSITATRGGDLMAGPQDLHLVLQFGLTVQNVRRDEDGKPETDDDGRVITEDRIPVTDAGLELQLDIIQRQALTALQVSSEPWAELWRRMVMNVEKIEMRRGAESEGARFAARELVFRVQIIREPGYASGISGNWPDVLALLEADEHLGYLANILRDLLGEAVDLPDWRVQAAQAGLSLAAARAMLLTPPPDAEATSPYLTDPRSTEPAPVGN